MPIFANNLKQQFANSCANPCDTTDTYTGRIFVPLTITTALTAQQAT
jgi:hypothetical protein